MLLCDHIVFWEKHRARPIVSDYELALMDLIVNWQMTIKDVFLDVLKEVMRKTVTKMLIDFKNDLQQLEGSKVQASGE